MLWEATVGRLSEDEQRKGRLEMARKKEFPKAIFYDSKNTLWMWDDVWKDACKEHPEEIQQQY